MRQLPSCAYTNERKRDFTIRTKCFLILEETADLELPLILSVVSHNESFRQIHKYYMTRTENPLKKMQSLTVIACKLLRIIFAILKKGVRFDPERMLRDIIYPVRQEAVA